MAGSTEMKTMELPSCPESLHDVVDAVEEVAAAIGMGDDSAEEVAIALTEAVNNAICHGNGGGTRNPCSYPLPSGTRSFTHLHNMGAGFDLDAVPAPLAEENLLKPSGRGLLVMRTIMDEVKHHFTESGTEVTRLKRMKNEESPAG